MIVIKTQKNNNAILKIKQGTPYTTILLGCEMLMEALINQTKIDVDLVLEDLKRIYLRDNGEKNGK